MRTINEITREDFDAMTHHKSKAYYDVPSANQLIYLVRTYINPGQGSCFNCGDALREAKTTLAEWYNQNKSNIEEILFKKENPQIEEKEELTKRIEKLKNGKKIKKGE